MSGAAEVYLSMVRAVHAGDWEGIRAALPPGRREMVEPEELEAMLGMLRRVTPREVEVVGVEEGAGKAVVMAWGDAFLTGMFAAIFVAFAPQWLATWSDRNYLKPPK